MRVASLGQLHLFRRGHKPEQAKPATEYRLACAFSDTLDRCAKPDWRWSAFPAGEHREAITGARLKRMGLKPGWPDYIFVSPEGRAHFLELKRRSGTLTHEQELFRDWCRACDVPWKMANSYDKAIAAVTKWGVLRLEVRPQ